MCRSGYDDCCEGWELIRWRGAVASAIRGARGQAFLRELLAAMDRIPGKRLVDGELITAGGQVCALGAVCKERKLDLEDVDVEDSEVIAKMLGIAEAMTKEIEYQNDEATWVNETPEERWTRVRQWVTRHIVGAGTNPAPKIE